MYYSEFSRETELIVCIHTHTHTFMCIYMYIYIYISVYLSIHPSIYLSIERDFKEVTRAIVGASKFKIFMAS